MASSFLMGLGHTQRRTSVGKTSIISSQRPLPDNTQQLQDTNIHAPAGF